MKAISIWQPWAQAIAVGAKRIETRAWWTAHRGPLAIHAAKRSDDELRQMYEWGLFEAVRRAGFARFDDLPLGAVVATCRLAECIRATDVDGLTRQERDLGDYSPGRYAWVLSDVRAVKTPIQYRGAQGLFEIPIIGEPVPGDPQMGLWTK
jgi:hypothetical protein